jgi:hypothetical protein
LRVISAPDLGGTLGGGRTLLRDTARFPAILQAQANPDGRSVVALTQRGRQLALARFAVPSGRLISVLYRQQALRGPIGPMDAFLSSDGTGKYPILIEDGGTVAGWVHGGVFHHLKLGKVELWGFGPAW